MSRGQSRFDREYLRRVGRRIRLLRMKHGWSLKKLAHEAGVSVAAIRKIEVGQSNPSLLTIVPIVESLGEPIDHLVNLARKHEDQIQVTRDADAASLRPGDRLEVSDSLSEPEMRGEHVRVAEGRPLELVTFDGRPPVFGYVLEGAVHIRRSPEHVATCHAGDSFHILGPEDGAIKGAAPEGAHVLLFRDTDPDRSPGGPRSSTKQVDEHEDEELQTRCRDGS